jgi:hypothetical protein
MLASNHSVHSVVLSTVLSSTTLLSGPGVPARIALADAGAGGHYHGSIDCGDNGYITVFGAQAERNGSPGPRGTSRVFYRAVLYKWNGSDWLASTASAWLLQCSFRYGTANFESAEFRVYQSEYFAAKTELV